MCRRILILHILLMMFSCKVDETTLEIHELSKIGKDYTHVNPTFEKCKIGMAPLAKTLSYQMAFNEITEKLQTQMQEIDFPIPGIVRVGFTVSCEGKHGEVYLHAVDTLYQEQNDQLLLFDEIIIALNEFESWPVLLDRHYLPTDYRHHFLIKNTKEGIHQLIL